MDKKTDIEEQKTTKKSKKIYLSLIFWLAIAILAYFSYQYFLSEFGNKQIKKYTFKNLPNQFSNNQTKTDKIDSTPQNKKEIQNEFENVENQKEILLKQQKQINELQNDYQNLKIDLQKLKSSQNLPKIILTFVNLGDLIDLGQNYDRALQNLELLSSSDSVMKEKIYKLKLALKNPPKGRLKLIEEFVELTPQIYVKKTEIEGERGIFGKLKSIIAKFIIIKKTGDNKSDFEVIINNSQKYIENGQYNFALQNLENLGPDYHQTLLIMKSDLQNGHNFFQIYNEIYSYLNMLSNS